MTEITHQGGDLYWVEHPDTKQKIICIKKGKRYIDLIRYEVIHREKKL